MDDGFGIHDFSRFVKEFKEKFDRRWKLDRDTGCWLWVGVRRKHIPGVYGNLDWGRMRLKAHRVAWMLHRGSIPSGMQLDHLCRRPDCVNPTHLDLVTHAENNRRKNKHYWHELAIKSERVD